MGIFQDKSKKGTEAKNGENDIEDEEDEERRRLTGKIYYLIIIKNLDNTNSIINSYII